MPELVTVVVGGAPFAQFTSVEVKASVKNAAREVTISGTLLLGGGLAPFTPNGVVTVSATGELIFTGYFDRYEPELAPDKVLFTASGRGKGMDAVDSSADHTKGDYINKTLLQIAQDQDAFGIGFSADYSMTPIDRTRVNIGESLFEFLRGHLGDEMATLSGQPDGSIKITRAGANAQRQPGTIIEGVNFYKGKADFDWSKRHSQIAVHGQAYKGTGASATQIAASVQDSGITRHRPLHIVHPGHTDKQRAQNRAANHRNAAAGESTKLPYTSPGWRDSAGALWMPGAKVWTQVPTLNLVQDMLIESVTYKQTEKDEYASLDLVDPAAHGGSGGGVNKSNPVWSTPS